VERKRDFLQPLNRRKGGEKGLLTSRGKKRHHLLSYDTKGRKRCWEGEGVEDLLPRGKSLTFSSKGGGGKEAFLKNRTQEGGRLGWAK